MLGILCLTAIAMFVATQIAPPKNPPTIMCGNSLGAWVRHGKWPVIGTRAPHLQDATHPEKQQCDAPGGTPGCE
jgi:hypothetical protein